MALTVTSLAAALNASDLEFKATSATGATVGGFARIDNEFSLITAISGTMISVKQRGTLGGEAVAHNILAPLTFGLLSDLGDPAAAHLLNVDTDSPAIQSYGVTGAIDPTLFEAPHTIVILTKASAAAMTLAGPTADQDGLLVTILSATAAAHTVTYTAGFYADTTSSDVATFAAKAGASMTIVARGATWGVIALGNVTIA